MFYLYYDNGTGYFDCASSHTSYIAARLAALLGFQTRQHIEKDGQIVWSNYDE